MSAVGKTQERPGHPADGVENDSVVAGVVAVGVGVPVPLPDVDLHVPPYEAHPLLLEHGVSKVWPGGGARPTGVDHLESPAISRPEGPGPCGPILPELDQKRLRHLSQSGRHPTSGDAGLGDFRNLWASLADPGEGVNEGPARYTTATAVTSIIISGRSSSCMTTPVAEGYLSPKYLRRTSATPR